MGEKTTEREFTVEKKVHSLCATKGCKGIRLAKRDFGDGKHCSKCIKKLRIE